MPRQVGTPLLNRAPGPTFSEGDVETVNDEHHICSTEDAGRRNQRPAC